jgi:hypothetical protein
MIDQSKREHLKEYELFQSQVSGKLSKLDRLDHYPTTWTIVYVVVGAVVAIIGLMLTILAFAGDRFDGGLGAGAAIGDKFAQNTIAIEKNSERDADLRYSVELLVKRMDVIIERQEKDAKLK